MQFNYIDNDRQSSLVAFLLVFTLMFGAGFGFLYMTKSGTPKEASHPLIQQNAPMTNS